jgi:hypothetical protein
VVCNPCDLVDVLHACELSWWKRNWNQKGFICSCVSNCRLEYIDVKVKLEGRKCAMNALGPMHAKCESVGAPGINLLFKRLVDNIF